MQSLILVPDPYFNEPGYQHTAGTPDGDAESRRYNANIRLYCVRWAMTDALLHPPTGMEEPIRAHFRLRGKDLLAQVAKWVAEAKAEESGRGAARAGGAGGGSASGEGGGEEDESHLAGPAMAMYMGRRSAPTHTSSVLEAELKKFERALATLGVS